MNHLLNTILNNRLLGLIEMIDYKLVQALNKQIMARRKIRDLMFTQQKAIK